MTRFDCASNGEITCVLKIGGLTPFTSYLPIHAKLSPLPVPRLEWGGYDPLSTPTRKYVHTFDMAEEAGYTFSLLDVGGGFKDSPIEQAATYRCSLIGVV